MRNRETSLAIALAAILLLPWPVRAEGPSREYQIKAAFIYNFAQFIEWPASAFASDTSPIVIGVLGGNPFGDALERIVGGKAVRGRPLTVVYFPRLSDLGQCHVLYVNSSDQSLLASLHEKLKDKSVLTIGEDEQFLSKGGVICFFDDNNKVRFEVSQKAAEQAQLKISSKLLRLAKIFAE